MASANFHKAEALKLLEKHGYVERDGIWHRPNGEDTMRLIPQSNGMVKLDCTVTPKGIKAHRKYMREAYKNM